MKKEYIQPSLTAINIETNGMLAASIALGGSTEQNLSRLFDDDEIDLASFDE